MDVKKQSFLYIFLRRRKQNPLGFLFQSIGHSVTILAFANIGFFCKKKKQLFSEALVSEGNNFFLKENHWFAKQSVTILAFAKHWFPKETIFASKAKHWFFFKKKNNFLRNIGLPEANNHL
jgi:hypothetical protein